MYVYQLSLSICSTCADPATAQGAQGKLLHDRVPRWSGYLLCHGLHHLCQLYVSRAVVLTLVV